MQSLLAGVVSATVANVTFIATYSLGPRVLLFLLIGTLCTLVAYAGLLARKLIAKLLIRTLILPATSIIEREGMPAGRGRSVNPRRLVQQLRRQHLLPEAQALDGGAGEGASASLASLVASPAAPGQRPVARSEAEVQQMLQAMAQAMGVHPSQLPPEARRMLQEPPRFTQHVIHGVDAGVRIDAAHYMPPSQASLPPAQRRWVVYLGGNGELYELLLEEMFNVARDSGLGVFLFNFRGVSHSEGEVHDASDLVVDCLTVLEYMQDHLGALPNNVLLYGHSIGGAVATLARAVHSPSGPLLSDRSFCSFDAAAHGEGGREGGQGRDFVGEPRARRGGRGGKGMMVCGCGWPRLNFILIDLCSPCPLSFLFSPTGVCNSIFKSITGFRFKIPLFVVRGALGSVFKGESLPGRGAAGGMCHRGRLTFHATLFALQKAG